MLEKSKAFTSKKIFDYKNLFSSLAENMFLSSKKVFIKMGASCDAPFSVIRNLIWYKRLLRRRKRY